MAMVQRPSDDTPGVLAGDARAAVVTGLSFRGAERVIETQITPDARLMSDEAKALMVIGESFAEHETVKHSSGEYVRDAIHVNSVEGLNSRVRRTIAGVFHHISPQHADLQLTTALYTRVCTDTIRSTASPLDRLRLEVTPPGS